MPTTLLQNPSVSQSLRTIPRTKKRTSMSWTTQLSASSLRFRKGWVCCCSVRSRSAISNPTKSRRSWSLPPKLMKSTTSVSTCEWTSGSARLMWSIHTVIYVDVTSSPRNYCHICCYTNVPYSYHSTRSPTSWSAQSSHTNSSRPRSRSRETELRARAERAGGFGWIGGSGTGGTHTAAAWPVATTR
eukprot:scaffold23879_cov71-Phaeocystis_antarctica.AAC.1